MTSDYLTIDEARELLGYRSKTSIQNLRQKNLLTAYSKPSGKRVYFKRSEVVELSRLEKMV